jgi:corrinoid protein of di/trimethylamine methyltransferase
MSELFLKMSQTILDGDAEAAAALAAEAVAAGIDPQQVIAEGYMPGLNQVGAAFACGESYLPELVMAGEAMKAAVAALEPEMQRRGSQRQSLGKVVLATVEGDIHEIGKSLVGTLLSSSGFQVFDLGVNVKAAAIVEKARVENADIVALSALLTTTMVRQREVIAALDEAGLRPQVKVMVGGAPVTDEWVSRIGADGTSRDAIGAVQVARRLAAEKE